MMAGDGAPRRDGNAGVLRGGDELVGVADAGEGEHRPRNRTRTLRMRRESAMPHWQTARTRSRRDACRAIAGADDKQRIHPAHLYIERRPQRPSREDACIADAAASICATAIAVGVLPAPPSVKLPMQITGTPARAPLRAMRCAATVP